MCNALLSTVLATVLQWRMGNQLEENFNRNFCDLLFETSLLAVYY